MKQTLALFGAGKIGRSFVAQIFARNGYEVVFVDVDTTIVDLLNERRRYTVVTLHNDGSREDYVVEGVRAISAHDTDGVRQLLLQTDLVATSVGAGAIPAVCAIMARASIERQRRGVLPFDVILAENMRDASAVALHHLEANGVDPQAMPGLIAASVGKTAPNVPSAEQAADPLLVHCDSYNTLIVSEQGWRHPAPQFDELLCVDTINAYVDRKLLIHNLGHCALAYIGFRECPDRNYIREVADHPVVSTLVNTLMQSSALALTREYPKTFDTDALTSYIADVADRMANPALDDTLWRVGRDIPRKIGRNERIMGALLLSGKHGLPINVHVELYLAALGFRAINEQGEYDKADHIFYDVLHTKGIGYVLRKVSAFNPDNDSENAIIQLIKEQFALS